LSAKEIANSARMNFVQRVFSCPKNPIFEPALIRETLENKARRDQSPSKTQSVLGFMTRHEARSRFKKTRQLEASGTWISPHEIFFFFVVGRNRIDFAPPRRGKSLGGLGFVSDGGAICTGYRLGGWTKSPRGEAVIRRVVVRARKAR
jgi:hypothetical protein